MPSTTPFPERPVLFDPALLLAAAALVDDIADWVAHDQATFASVFRLGYGHGYDIGFRHGRNELARELEQDWATMKHLLRGPTPGELERRRAEVGPLALGFRQRWYGGGQYPGGPVPGLAEEWERWATCRQARREGHAA